MANAVVTVALGFVTMGNAIVTVALGFVTMGNAVVTVAFAFVTIGRVIVTVALGFGTKVKAIVLFALGLAGKQFANSMGGRQFFYHLRFTTTKYRIANTESRLVVAPQLQVTAGASTQNINTASLSNGEYYIRLISEEGQTNLKFVKRR